MSSNVLNDLNTLTCLFLSTLRIQNDFYHYHFTDGETDARGGCWSAESSRAQSGSVEIPISGKQSVQAGSLHSGP